MPRPRTPEEIRRLKERGVFDVATHYSPHGLNKVPKQKYWDSEEDED